MPQQFEQSNQQIINIGDWLSTRGIDKYSRNADAEIERVAAEIAADRKADAMAAKLAAIGGGNVTSITPGGQQILPPQGERYDDIMRRGSSPTSATICSIVPSLTSG